MTGVSMQKKNLTNVAYDYLFTKICNGELPPNSPIVEQEISSELSISRTPVREAMQALESVGLISHIQYKGTFVRELTLEDIDEIFEIRKLFEIFSLRAAFERMEKEEIESMLSKVCSISEDSSLEAFYEVDRLLHNVIVQHSYNSRMIQFYHLISAQIEYTRRLSSGTPKRMTKSRSEHIEILEAMKAGDLERTEKCLDRHLDNVHKSVVDVVKQMRAGLKKYNEA